MSTQNLPLTNSSRRSKLAFAALAMALAGVITPASAANFQYRHPVYGLTAPVSIGSQAQQAAAEIVVALTGGPSLPAGEVNWPYSYDLKQLLSVTGDNNWSTTNVSWNLPSGSLPAGLSLGTDGVISGVPTTKDSVGASFQVKASYKGKDGQQVYTIVVNGQVLRVTQVAAGFGHTCALTTTGGVKCWGRNSEGQLGNNSAVQQLAPVNVVGLSSGVINLAAGMYHTCAVTSTNGVKCWGGNGGGQLGNGNTTNSYVPLDVTGLASGIASVAGGANFSCALTTGSGVKCWGGNTYGQLGNNSTAAGPSPVDVSNLSSGVTSLALGNYHACAVVSGGAKCWGYNYAGQVGNNSTTTAKVPADVSGLTSGVLSVTAGAAHACAVTSVGGVKCWGQGTAGQLGNNGLANSLVPVNVSNLSAGVGSVGAGGFHTCAVLSSGAAKCWGNNASGQLGNNGTTTSKVPVDVVGLTSDVSFIVGGANGSHTCAATASGLKCWGNNADGELGNNSTTNSLVPADVTP